MTCDEESFNRFFSPNLMHISIEDTQQWALSCRKYMEYQFIFKRYIKNIENMLQYKTENGFKAGLRKDGEKVPSNVEASIEQAMDNCIAEPKECNKPA